ncbi:MAG: hypothetical protein NTV70_19475 [Acidobacteria bacterium]|nr:hypothetical protein [Acidobacteriota bacterium]
MILLLMLSLAAEPVRVGTFLSETRFVHDTARGLPSNDVRGVAVQGPVVYAATMRGLAVRRGGEWVVEQPSGPLDHVAAGPGGVWVAGGQRIWKVGAPRPEVAMISTSQRIVALAAGMQLWVATESALFRLQAGALAQESSFPGTQVRQIAIASDERVAVAAQNGLFLRSAQGAWENVRPSDGRRSWAPLDLRGVAFDEKGRLWFASPQGVGVLDGGRWTLYDASDGIPYGDFTSVAASNGRVWLGTTKGVVTFDGKHWGYRQGKRWLADDAVRQVAAAADGSAWVAGNQGVTEIALKPLTLAAKAKQFDDEIEKRHRRTPLGYVLEAHLKRPGELSEWTNHDSDNDGLWTSMYGAAQCFAYGATGSAEAKARAMKAFEALRFLGTVTQSGDHPAPPGFVARTILPGDGPNPNQGNYTPEGDRKFRDTRDKLWKVISPRWPRTADGKWYWKSDTSSDELDGHFFFYGLYFDLVAKTEAERAPVREHLRAMGDHFLAHGFNYVDHDGKPTRWGYFDPASLNHNHDFWGERGMNSLSILAYLKVVSHITGDPKYDQAARKLIDEHGYEMNVLFPKTHGGPGAGNQSDDEMIFMNFYSLLRYEKDARLRGFYLRALAHAWENERPEMNPFFNFIYATLASGEKLVGTHDTLELTPKGAWLEDSIDTLKRIPLDRANWRLSHAHRQDLRPIGEARGRQRGHRLNGKVLPADEQYVQHWNHDPWSLEQGGDGRSLGDGAVFLLPYYMGLYHGFLRD